MKLTTLAFAGAALVPAIAHADGYTCADVALASGAHNVVTPAEHRVDYDIRDFYRLADKYLRERYPSLSAEGREGIVARVRLLCVNRIPDVNNLPITEAIDDVVSLLASGAIE
jgi:hypothetical protein